MVKSVESVKPVSRGQILELLSRFPAQIDWDSLDGGELQRWVISLSPYEFSCRFTAFLKAGARLNGLRVDCFQFDIANFLGINWAFWRGPRDGCGLEGEEERDKVSAALMEVNLERTDFLICSKKGENSITGENKLVRLRELNRPLYGANQFIGLWRDFIQNKADSVLERFYEQRGIACLDFFGDVLRCPNGRRYVFNLCRFGGASWSWGLYQLAHYIHNQGLAMATKQLPL